MSKAVDLLTEREELNVRAEKITSNLRWKSKDGLYMTVVRRINTDTTGFALDINQSGNKAMSGSDAVNLAKWILNLAGDDSNG